MKAYRASEIIPTGYTVVLESEDEVKALKLLLMDTIAKMAQRVPEKSVVIKARKDWSLQALASLQGESTPAQQEYLYHLGMELVEAQRLSKADAALEIERRLALKSGGAIEETPPREDTIKGDEIKVESPVPPESQVSPESIMATIFPNGKCVEGEIPVGTQADNSVEGKG